MNYLAHLLLAEDDPLSRIGNLLGDFVAGRPETLTQKLPLRAVQGIVRHRAIDRFADEHPVTAHLKTFVAPERRRFAGVIVDLVHDHFLTRHWNHHSPHPLREFIDTCNEALRDHFALLPPFLADTLEERIADDWLGHYGTDDGLDGVFYRVSLRNPAFLPSAAQSKTYSVTGRSMKRDSTSSFQHCKPGSTLLDRKQRSSSTAATPLPSFRPCAF